MTTTPKTVHVYFLLDASGSMESLRHDVIGGFNNFCREQITPGITTLMTVVQFDTQEPQLVVANAVDVREIAPLTTDTYRPRGSTPLYDAMGQLLTEATIRAEGNDYAEEVIFVVFTDGEENASREYNRAKIFEIVKKREELGWTFVYLGANQDSYAAGGRAGFDGRSVQNFEASAEGVDLAFRSMSRSMIREKGKMMRGEARLPVDFFEGEKDAEQRLNEKN